MRIDASGSHSALLAAGGCLLLGAAVVSAAQAQTPTLGTCIARYSVTTVWLSAPGIYQYGAFDDAYDAGNQTAPYIDPNFVAGRYGVKGQEYGELVGERYLPPSSATIAQLCPELGSSYMPTTEDRFDLVYVSYPPGHPSAIFDTLFSGGGQLPGVPVSNFTWSPATVYQGVPVSFLDTSSGQPTTAWSWTFQNASPATASVEDPSNVIFTSAGNQQVTLQASNVSGPSSNVASQYVQVLSPAPAVSSIVITPPSPSICQAVSFAAVGAAGEPPLEYAWNVTRDGVSVFSSTLAAPTWSTNADANSAFYEVSLTLTNPQNTELSATAQASFTLQALPALGVETPTYDPFSGGRVQFHVLSTGATTWSWDFGDGTPLYTSSDPTLGPNPPAHTYGTSGSFNVTVTVSSCTPGSVTSQALTVQVDRSSGSATLAVAGPASGLVGTASTFTASAVNCTPAATWTWNVAGGTVSGSSTGSSIAISWAAAGNYTVSATNSACSGASGSATIAIGPGSLGSSFAYNPASPIAGSPVTFDGSASTGSPTSYYWAFGDGGVDGSGAIVGHTYANAGSFAVQLSVSRSVSATACAAVGGLYQEGTCTVTSTQTVSVAPPPPPPVTAVIESAACQGPGTTLTCTSVAGDNVTFASGSNSGTTGWTWDFGDGTTASGETTSHAWSTPGNYTVTLTVTGGAAQSAAASAAMTVDAPPVHEQVLPWIWPVSGTGTRVMSRNFYAFNPGTTPLTLTVQFLRHGRVPTQSVTIPPLQTFVSADPLGLFTPRVTNGPGFLEFTWSSPSGAVPVIGGESGIYTGGNALPDVGQTIAATMVVQDPSRSVVAGQPPLYLIGLAESANRITTLALSDPFSEPAFVNIHFFDAAGNAVGAPVLFLEIGQEGERQLTAAQLQQTYGVSGEDLYAVIDTLAGGPITAHGVVMPVTSQDPSYVWPGVTNLATQYLLGVRTGGSGTTAVATDVVLTNPDNVPMQVQMAFVNTLVRAPSPPPATLILAPGTTTRIIDVLHAQWNITQGTIGTLIFTSPAAADGIYPIIRGESYLTRLGPASRLGNVIPAQGAGSTSNLTLLNLQQDGSHSTKLWIFNTSPIVATFDAVYLDNNGNVLGTKKGIQLGPGKMGRLRPTDHPIPASVPGGFTVRVRPIAGTLLAAGLVQNTATGDTTYVGPALQ
jgi:PKD repeat protein